MAELTPIPAEHRKVYYDALLAGRDEAQRLGYGLMDDRIFAAFHRALYGPMVELIDAATRRQVAEELLATTVQVTWPDGRTSLKLAEVMDAAREHYAAIARGRGETYTKEQK